MIKRERLRQIFKDRFEDFDADNRCVTKFVISKFNGLRCVELKCSIDITENGKGINGGKYLSDIDDRCKWVGDFFKCSVYILWCYNNKGLNVYITPLTPLISTT